MRADSLRAVAGGMAALFLLGFMPVASWAAAAKCGEVDCTTIQNSTSGKESFTVSEPEMVPYMNRGWSVPPQWIPDEGKGVGMTSSGAAGFSYGGVKAPESPPGARNENASVSNSAITAGCNFPPRIKIGIPPKISMPSGTCLNFINGLFKDKNGNDSTTAAPVGVDAADTCPIESNNDALYGVKQPAVGAVAATCGAIVPTATADITLNANATELATTTNGSYYIWTYRKAGANFAARLNAVKLPSYLCEVKDSYGKWVKTTDLTPPTEQMITYNRSAGYIAVRLQSRATMPATFLPPYNPDDPEKFLILRLNASGDPIIPADCARETGNYQPTTVSQSILIQSARIGGSSCASIVPTIVNYPRCSPGGGNPPCGFPRTTVDNWISICNPSKPLPPYAAKILPVGGVCAMNPTGGTCSESSATVDANCDVVSMPVPESAGASCAGKVQYSALNRPGLFYPPATTAVFDSISGRTQVMAETVTGNRFYMQTNTIVKLQSSAPSILLTEGGTLVETGGTNVLMNAPATINPASGSVILTNGGQRVSAGGTQLAFYPAGSSVALGSPPYELHVGRSLDLPAGFMVPTVPTIGSQPPYAQLPVAAPPP